MAQPIAPTARGKSACDGALAFLIGALCGLLVQSAHVFGHAFVNLDFGVHYAYAREYAAAFAAGNYWPRWAMQAQAGLGEPGLLYYAPLYYWATGLISELTGNVWLAMQIVEITASALLGYFTFRLTALYASRRRALIAPVIACLSPMLVMLQLEFNGYPWACAFAPLAAYLWAMLRPRARTTLVNIPAIVALGLTILTHTVTGLMAVIVTAPLVLCAFGKKREALLDWRLLGAPVITIAGGLALSAVYLFPAFTLQGLISSAVWRTNYTPFDAFSLPTFTAWLFGIRWAAFQWPISFVMIAAGLLGCWLIWREREARLLALRLPISLIVGAAVFLSIELSYPFWLIDSPLRDVQFPHRFLTILAPLLPVLVLAPGPRHRWARAALWLLALAGVAMGVFTLARATLAEGMHPDLNEAVFAPYTGLDEYRTRWAQGQRSSRSLAEGGSDCANHRLACAAFARGLDGISGRVIAPRAGRYTLPLYYFPAWHLSVNGREAPITPDPKTGLVRAVLVGGNDQLAFLWSPLPQERIGFAISVVMLLVMIIAAVKRRHRPERAAQAWATADPDAGSGMV